MPRAWPILVVVTLAALGVSTLPALGARTTDDESSAASMPAAPGEQSEPIVQRIDELLATAWHDAGVTRAPQTADGEFLRRASLDLTGVIPRTSEVRDFLADERPDKRAQLIVRLLASPRYATHMATTWRNRILPLGVDSQRPREASGLQKWLRTRFADNTRYDRIVGGLLLATGENELGPALYFQANDLAPEKLAGSAAELFMGVDLHCAQCHDHPFADWSQKDFWSVAAFFARTTTPATTAMAGETEMADRVVDIDRGEVMLPESDEVVPPRFPRGDAAETDPWQTRRSQFVVWLTSRDNPFFARATVNSAWAHLFGAPLVESILPLKGEGPSTQRQILDDLAQHFVDSNYDIRALWRTLATTRAYQLSSRHPSAAEVPPELFARMLPKPLTPEQLFDSVVLVAPLGTPAANGMAGAAPIPQGLDEDPRRIEFVRQMRTPAGNPTEYRASTLQALALMNGRFTAAAASPEESRLLGALAAPYLSDEERVDAMFLATLARAPSNEERTACLAALGEDSSDHERALALGDLLWALVNSTEFGFNH